MTKKLEPNSLSLAFRVAGKDLQVHINDGRPCVISQDLGRTLGYADSGFRNTIKSWDSELIKGKDYEILSGDKLLKFIGSTKNGLPTSLTRLKIFYESGIDIICIKSDKPIGKELRRLWADEVAPKLRRGEPLLPKGYAAVPIQSLVGMFLLPSGDCLTYEAIWREHYPVFAMLMGIFDYDGGALGGSMPKIQNIIYRAVFTDVIHKEAQRKTSAFCPETRVWERCSTFAARNQVSSFARADVLSDASQRFRIYVFLSK